VEAPAAAYEYTRLEPFIVSTGGITTTHCILFHILFFSELGPFDNR
jgi:hypothetical protein